jgi:excisionase family DNA binding protein
MGTMIVIEESAWKELTGLVRDLKSEFSKFRKGKTEAQNMTHQQAAKYLGYSTKRLYTFKDEGKITFSQHGGKIIYRREDLDEFLEKYRVKRKTYT